MKWLNIRGDLCSFCQYHNQIIAATTKQNLATSMIQINIVRALENIVHLLYLWHYNKKSEAQFILVPSSNALGKTDVVSPERILRLVFQTAIVLFQADNTFEFKLQHHLIPLFKLPWSLSTTQCVVHWIGYVKVAEDLKHLCFFSVKVNISTTGGFRVGFFQPDTNHP